MRDYIFKFKRDAPMAANGLSTDFLQDLIRFSPRSLPFIAAIPQMIAFGYVDDDNREIIMRARGLPIRREDGNIRPIAIQCPLYKITSHLINNH
jgi:hypothetical protein